MTGWNRRFLDIDLTSSTTTVRPLTTEYLLKAPGGRALGLSLFNKSINCQSEQIVLATSPLNAICGLSAPMLSLTSWSPLTNTLSSWSISGSFASELHDAGFDAIRICGQANDPSLLKISVDSTEIVAADMLWGRSPAELRKHYSTAASTLSIGIAGEMKGLFAEVVIDSNNIESRGGIGALLGAMKLKGIVIDPLSDPEPAHQISATATDDIERLIKASPYLSGRFGIGNYGSATLIDLIEERLMTLTDKFTESSFPASKEYSAPRWQGLEKLSDCYCPGCTIACHKYSKGLTIPDIATISAFGSQIGNSDIELILKANSRCTELGIDPQAVAAAFATVVAAQRNDPSVQSVDLLAFIEQLALDPELQRELLGSKHYQDRSVKGIAIPAFDPRGGCGIALGIATSTRGADHNFTQAYSHEILRKPVPTDRFTFVGKARMNVLSENAIAAAESLGICPHILTSVSLEEYLPILNQITGGEWQLSELMMLGERVILTERYQNYSRGTGPKTDDLPDLYFAKDGSSSADVQVTKLDRDDFLSERGIYYQIRGLNPDGSFPDSFDDGVLL